MAFKTLAKSLMAQVVFLSKSFKFRSLVNNLRDLQLSSQFNPMNLVIIMIIIVKEWISMAEVV